MTPKEGPCWAQGQEDPPKLVTVFLMSHHPVFVVQLFSWAVYVVGCRERVSHWGQNRCVVFMATTRVKDSGNKQAGPVGFQAGSVPRVIKWHV